MRIFEGWSGEWKPLAGRRASRCTCCGAYATEKGVRFRSLGQWQTHNGRLLRLGAIAPEDRLTAIMTAGRVEEAVKAHILLGHERGVREAFHVQG